MWLLLIIGGIALYFWLKGRGGAEFKNSILCEEGFCLNCKYCIKNSADQWICRLSKCDNITDDTYMSCCEKPRVTEDDLRELFQLSIWNEAGMNYIHDKILGQRMGWLDINEFLTQLPNEHPEFIANNR